MDGNGYDEDRLHGLTLKIQHIILTELTFNINFLQTG